MRQRAENPFPHSNTNKRYYTFDYYTKTSFGGKAAKLPLDGGMTCPNIDGRSGNGGCIYCSSRGSGDFAPPPTLSIREQYEVMRELLGQKWDMSRVIPYLQAHTNTYAPVERLRRVYAEAMALPHAVALHIATRADCLPAPVLSLLREVSEEIPLTVELGLQSAFDDTAACINRGHTRRDFLEGYFSLRRHVPRARIAVHLINGLPDEDRGRMVENARFVADLCVDEVKIHLLHVIAGTELARMYERGAYTPMSEEAYVRVVAEQLTLLPPDTVIGRLTGDGDRRSLLAPLWSLKKTVVLNEIDKLLAREGRMQGDAYRPRSSVFASELPKERRASLP